MKIEICDLCNKPVSTHNKTKVIIKDCKGLEFDEFGRAWPCKRKFEGVICDECLQLLKEKRGNHAD